MSNKQLDLTFVKMINETYDRHKQVYKKESKKYVQMCIVTIITLLACTYLIARILYNPTTDYTVESQESQQAEYTYNPYIENLTHEEINIDSNYTDNMEYFVRCVTAEAGNQDDYGKRLVIDVILNSCDKYNMTTTDVINADGRFEVVSNNSINTVEPDLHVYDLISEEITTRTNSDILYFRTNKYHSFGTPVMKHQAHYFSMNVFNLDEQQTDTLVIILIIFCFILAFASAL